MPLDPVNHSAGIPFIELQSVDSTNNYALAQIRADLAVPGTCFFAHEQRTGKGQRAKTWTSEKGANITMSLSLQPYFLQVFEQFYLSACIALATCEFLGAHTHGEVKIKWPNDLYWKDKKLGGILIENVIGEQGSLSNWKWAVVGIGLNINQTQFEPAIKNPVSLKQITGKNFQPVLLAHELCSYVNRHYTKLQLPDRDGLFDQYNANLYKKGQLVKLKSKSRVFEASVIGVNRSGQLLIQHAYPEVINFGDVEWIHD